MIAITLLGSFLSFTYDTTNCKKNEVHDNSLLVVVLLHPLGEKVLHHIM